jgi:hypothetical protein
MQTGNSARILLPNWNSASDLIPSFSSFVSASPERRPALLAQDRSFDRTGALGAGHGGVCRDHRVFEPAAHRRMAQAHSSQPIATGSHHKKGKVCAFIW